MTTRHLLITVDAEEATCGPCQYAEYQGCGLTGTRWSVAGGGREPGCHAAERAHAEAIAQARREAEKCSCGHTRGGHNLDAGCPAYLSCTMCTCGAYTPAGDDG